MTIGFLTSPRRAFTRCTLAFAVVTWTVATAFAQPRVDALTASQVGEARRIELRGAGLGESPKVWFFGRGEPQTASPAAGDRAVFQATLSPDEPAGRTLAFVEGETGLAGPFPLTFDNFAGVEYAELEKASRPVVPPTAVSGVLTGDAVHTIRVQGKAGQTLDLEIEAKRLGSKLNPVLRLFGDRGTQLAWAQGTNALEGDARLNAILPADGEYRVELHDGLYRGATPGRYRLKIGDGSSARVEYPPIPFGETLPQAIEGQTAANFGRDVPADAKAVTAPLGLNGALVVAGEEDRWKIGVEAGKTYRFDLLAARAGSPLDGVLTLYDAEGKKSLATSDDQAKSSDGMIEYAVPKDVKELTVAVKDLLGRGGREFTYHVSVTDAKAPSVEVIWPEEPVYLNAGGRTVLRGTLVRKNYPGPVLVKLAGTVADLKFGASAKDARDHDSKFAEQSIHVPEKSDEFLFAIDDVGTNPGAYRLQAKVFDPEQKVELGQGERGESVPARYLPKYRHGLFVVRGARPAMLQLQLGEAPRTLPLGLKTSIALQAKRTDLSPGKPMRGVVRYSLVTDQPQTKKTIKENNKDKQVDDPERMIRVGGMPTAAADQAEAKLEVIVPGDLPRDEYRLAIKGELLAEDGKTVVATAWTPIEAWKTERPLAIEWENKPIAGKPAEVRAGTGETYSARGRIVRGAGLVDPVRVTVAGWPVDLPAPSIDVPADQTEFALPIRWPHALGKMDLTKLELVALAIPRIGPPAAGGARSAPSSLPIKIVPGDAPELRVTTILFDEAVEFLTRVPDGKGELAIDDKNHSRGVRALRLGGGEKSAASMAGLALPVREQPGPGEIRYIRFAVSRQGGTGVGLQIGHDGRFGPDAKDGPSFRYHAGPGETLGASLRVAEKHDNLKYTVVTRDLYADFGPFTFTGLGFVPGDTQVAYYDQLIVGATLDDLERVTEEYGATSIGELPKQK